MEVKNAVLPNENQIKEFNEQIEDKPIYMINLLKFREKQYTLIKEKPILLEKRLMQYIPKKLRNIF